MKLAIRRRSIVLAPPRKDDLAWAMNRAPKGVIPGGTHLAEAVQAAYDEGRVIAGIVRAAEADARRIGVVILLPDPTPGWWAYNIFILDPGDRNAFFAIHASDASSRYMFDELGIAGATWRIREDNARARVLARRLGYAPQREHLVGGALYHCYALNPAQWARRRTRLESRASDRGEPAFELLKPKGRT